MRGVLFLSQEKRGEYGKFLQRRLGVRVLTAREDLRQSVILSFCKT